MKLEKIETATAKTGNPFFKLTIDGKNYNYFGEIGEIKVGDFVLCEFKTSGKYTNLAKITKTTENVQPGASNGQIIESRHDIVINRVEKPHSWEFGKTNNRHKVYYAEISELKAHIEALKEAGFVEANDFFEQEKI